MSGFSCLVVSFIGNTDLRFGGKPDGYDRSPIERLLGRLRDSTLGLNLDRRPIRLMLFNDDPPGVADRQEFCQRLIESRKALGFGTNGLDITAVPIDLPHGPTDLDGLYRQVLSAMKKEEREQGRAEQVVFHLSSGTPPMYHTLVLAGFSLPLKRRPVFVETHNPGQAARRAADPLPSPRPDVRQVPTPYVLAAKRLPISVATQATLPARVRRALVPNTVIDDPQVETVYAGLFRAAERERKTSQVPRIIVSGPTGSGKWRACLQFARWRERPFNAWDGLSQPPVAENKATLVVRRLDEWSMERLGQLQLIAAERPDVAIVASWRSPQVPADVLPKPVTLLTLPAYRDRIDKVALGLALAKDLDLKAGLLRERLGCDWIGASYPGGLHDLRALLETAAPEDQGVHLESAAFGQLADRLYAQNEIETCLRILTSGDFSGSNLVDVLQRLKEAIVLRTMSEGRSQDVAAERLGGDPSQKRISEILRMVRDRRRSESGTE